MKRAFTLIELLVVIAIIAILAAILFPVFAQAKAAAKKTAGLSNTKQMGTALNIYTADVDDTMPLAVSRRADGTYRATTVHPFPNGAIGAGWDDPTIMAQNASQWAVSLLPYVKSGEMYGLSGQLSTTLPGEAFSTVAVAKEVGLSYNGLLNKLSGTSIEGPSVVPAFWSGTGNISLKGRSSANPALLCTGKADDCSFNANGRAQSDNSAATGTQNYFFGYSNYNASWSPWSYDGTKGSIVVARTDSSAKVYKVGQNTDPNQSNLSAERDPYASVTKTAGGLWQFSYYAVNSKFNGDCSSLTAENTDPSFPKYVCFFRPDRVK